MTETKDLTTGEAADMLKVSPSTVWYWYKAGTFPNAYKLHPTARNSPIRIPRADVQAIIDGRRAFNPFSRSDWKKAARGG